MTASAVEPHLREALRRAARTPYLLVASDYDGTLAPIVADRDSAWPVPESVQALVSLSALAATGVVVVSGRALVDLRRLSGLPATVRLVGSHGVELDDGWLDDETAARRDQLLDAVRTVTDGVVGVSLEPKPAGVAVHVRAASRPDAARVLDALRAGPASTSGVLSLDGKEVLELSVVDTDKGEALEALRTRARASTTVFVGDDRTDESAFLRLRPTDVGVKVGPGVTAAEHRVPDPQSVADVLTVLAADRAVWAGRT